MKNRKKRKAAVRLLSLIVLSAALVTGFSLIEKMIDKRESELLGGGAFSYSVKSDGLLLYEDTRYVPKDSLETVLILLRNQKIAGPSEDSQKLGQADDLTLLILDKEQQSFQVLQLNMTGVSQAEIAGGEDGTVNAQLALTHFYGDDNRARGRNTVKTVENLLCGIDIDHYLALDPEVVPVLNDSVGGVEVSLTEDFTELDESFVEGAVVTLNGEQALAYVQERRSPENDTDLHLAKRQKQYLSALLAEYKEGNPKELISAVLKVGDYMASDFSVSQLSGFFEKIGTYTNQGVLSLEGNSVKGQEYMEYYIDESAARAMIVELFYEPQE